MTPLAYLFAALAIIGWLRAAYWKNKVRMIEWGDKLAALDVNFGGDNVYWGGRQ